MTKHDIASLSCKLLGIYFIVNSLAYCIATINTIISWIQGNEFSLFVLTYIGPTLIYLIFGLLLWFYGSIIAKNITKTMELTSEEHTKSTAYDIQAIGFSLIGLYLLGSAIPKLSSYVVAIVLVPNTNFSTISRGIETVVQVVIGLGLLLGSKGLLCLVKTLRYSGGKKEENDSESNSDGV
ncbi:MAG: hypothetical protein PHI90_10055 [Clostridia bacterium]|nr:hypothetical protein [Clostridia bacterium]